MPKIKNISTGARGAYIGAQLVMVEAGATAEGDFTDVNSEWFEGGGRASEDSGDDRPGLSGKNKAELLEIADAEGVEVEDGATNDDIRAAIELKRES